MSQRPRDPFAGVERVVVDGTNLLYALARRGSPTMVAGGGSATPSPAPAPAPPAALIGRLRAAVPPGVLVDVVLDGSPDPGLATRRIAAGVTVTHAGRRSADAAIAALVEAEGARRPSGAGHILVVTDDGELRSAVRALGARTDRQAWLLARIARERLSSPAAGRPSPPATPGGTTRPPTPRGMTPTTEGDEDRAGWRPGRGATVKRGNPRRRPRADRRDEGRSGRRHG